MVWIMSHEIKMTKNVMHELITDYYDECVRHHVNCLIHHVCNVGSIVMMYLNHEHEIMQYTS